MNTFPENPQLPKLLRAMAGGELAKANHHDVILDAAALELEERRKLDPTVAQPGSRRYYVTLTPDQELSMTIFAQHNEMFKPGTEFSEQERQHLVHDALRRIVETTAAVVKEKHATGGTA